MRLLVLPDIHDRLDRVDRILTAAQSMKIQAILCVGDISSKLRPRERPTEEGIAANEKVKDDLLRRIQEILPLPFLYVPGNHDAPLLGWTQKADGSFQSDGYNTDHQLSTLNGGVTVYGIGGSPYCGLAWPYEWNEVQQQNHVYKHYPHNNPPHIILSHAPPAKSKTAATKHGTDAGSSVIANLAASHKGLLLCGHIHEGVGVDQINDCTVVNVGALGTSHACCRLVVVDYEPTTRTVSDVSMNDLEAA